MATVLAMAANFWALNPKDLDAPMEKKISPIVIQTPPPAEVEPPPPPPESQKTSSTLQDLAPESFSTPQDLGAGIGFGQGGHGPAIGGGGGFGADSTSLVQKATPDHPPKAVLKSPPDYPSEARSRGVSGFVVVKILVGMSGAIENVAVEESEPSGFFDQAALDAVKRWRFEPALKNGKVVADWTKQRIKFELN